MSLGRDLLLLLALAYTANATCTETQWSAWTDCCITDPGNDPIIRQNKYRDRVHCDEDFELTLYDKEECEDQYGAWGNWTECRLSGSCGDSYGFWERDRTVCSGDNDVFTQYEVSVCAEGFSGDDCTTCEDDYWMNSSGDCIACDCNYSGSLSGTCTDGTDCQCRSTYSGATCDSCSGNAYLADDNLCYDCACNTIGTSGGSTSCSDSSGDCTCDTFNGYTGLKCDDCVSGFYLSGDGQTCISCLCNNGGTSGGLTSCSDITGDCTCDTSLGYTGLKCYDCIDGYYLAGLGGSTCIDCSCNTFGTSGGSTSCSDTTGQCTCDSSNGYSGTQCEDCVSGYYLSGDGSTCVDCSCNTIGTSGGSTSCSDTSGDCTCDTFNGYTGLKCDDCVSGFYLSGDGQTCISCLCNNGGTSGGLTSCSDITGDCTCDTSLGYTGLKCYDCIDGYYLAGLGGSTCIDCSCNTIGTSGGSTSCSDTTGQCTCDSSNGYSGTQCEDCVSGYYLSGDGSTCVDCSCNTIGTSGGSTSCSDTSGDCTCDTFNGYTGLKCDDCVSGFYLSGDGQTCISCLCNNGGTSGGLTSCSDITGDCTCDTSLGYTGLKCYDCIDGYYLAGLGGSTCIDCSCNTIGTSGGSTSCSDSTGQCTCDSSNGYSGTQCEDCVSGYYLSGDGSTCVDCSCNTIGTSGGSTSCSDTSGDCTCDTFNGYTGLKCDDCVSGFYLSGDGQTCISCLCNNGGTSGGLTSCSDITGDCTCDTSLGYTGLKCYDCIDGYYLAGLGGSTCIDCSCNTIGTSGGSTSCSDSTGQCTCDSSNGYSGTQCDDCVSGYYLSGDGSTCVDCACNTVGTFGSSACSDSSGVCTCDSSAYSGDKCDDCIDGYYLSGDGSTCVDCSCNTIGTSGGSTSCSDTSGDCYCAESSGYTGLKCDDCLSGYYLSGDESTCVECNCNTSGTIGSSTTCSDTTGQCSCDTGYTGIDCDECEADFYLSDFNTCTMCPNGWFFFNTTCYFAISEKVTHADADSACQAFTDGKLFEPKSVEENTAIYDIMSMIHGATLEYWVGIKAFADEDPDGSSFVYLSDESSVDMAIWGTNAVSNRANVDHCIGIHTQSFGMMWTDRYCSDKYAYVCEKVTYAAP